MRIAARFNVLSAARHVLVAPNAVLQARIDRRGNSYASTNARPLAALNTMTLCAATVRLAALCTLLTT